MTAELLAVKRAQRRANQTGHRFCVVDSSHGLRVVREEIAATTFQVVLETCSPVTP